MAGDCSCIKGESNFEFKLDSLSSKALLFQDLSDWMDEPNYDTPTEYTLSVVAPGYKEPTDIVINLQKWNKLTSKELFGTENKSIPDGVYCLSVTNCGNTYTRWTAITYRLECCEKKLFLDGVDTSELESLIKQIKYSAEFQNAEVAKVLYKRALSKVQLMNCSC